MCSLSPDWPLRARRAVPPSASSSGASVDELARQLDGSIESSDPVSVRERLALLIEHFASGTSDQYTETRTERLLDWAARFLAPHERASDLVPGWDPELRCLFDAVAEAAPDQLARHMNAFPERAQGQLAFALALRGHGAWPEAIMPAVARRYLNTPEHTFAYEGRIPVSQLALATRNLLRSEHVPLMQWGRIAPLLQDADDDFRYLILVNYCALDFRSRALELTETAGARFYELAASGLETGALPFTGAIAAALVLTDSLGGTWNEALPAKVRQALLYDLRCGSDVEATVSLRAYSKLSPALAGELLAACLGEERAIALIPAIDDSRLIAELLASLKGNGAPKPVVLESLVACGDRALPQLVEAAESKNPSAELALACVEVLTRLGAPESASVLVQLLGHKSKRVVAASMKILERMDERARPELERGTHATKKSVRTQCERLLARLAGKVTHEETPLTLVRARTAGLPERVREAFLTPWNLADTSEATWQSQLQPSVRAMGAPALELLREWFHEKLMEGETRLWCYAVEELRSDPEAVWVAVDTFARMPKLSASLWARPRRALRHCGALLGPPIVHCLRSVHTEYREVLFGLLAPHAAEVEPEIFLEGLSDGSKAVRTHAVDGLSRSTDGPLDQVAELLHTGDIGTRIAAAELMAVWGRHEAAPAVAQAWTNERSQQVRPYLEDALVACGREDLVFSLPSGADLDERAAERFLCDQQPVRDSLTFLRTSQLPELHFRNGATMSEAPKLGLLARLTLLDSSLKGRVIRRLLGVLESSGVHAWSRFIYESWSRARAPKHHWAILQLSLLGDDDLLDEAMAGLGHWRGSEHSAITAHLRAAQWHGSVTSVRWLGYWSEHLASLGARSTARQLLGRVAFRNGVSLRQLRKELQPFIAEERADRLLDVELESNADRQRQLFELERSWLSGRSWEGHALIKLFGLQRYLEGERILLRRIDGTLCRYIRGELVDFDGRVAPLGDRYGLAHPLDLAEIPHSALAAPLGQPSIFAQLDRSTYSPSQFAELLGLTASAHAFAQFRRYHRWLHGEPMDAGIVYSDSLHLLGRGLIVTLHHSGYEIGSSESEQPVRILGLTFSDLEGTPVRAAELPRIAYSEIHRSLVQVFDRPAPNRPEGAGAS